MIPAAVPLGVELGHGLSAAMRGERMEWLQEMIPTMREGVFYDLGVKIPGLQVRAQAPGLGAQELVVSIDEVPVAQVEIPAGHVLVQESVDELAIFQLAAKPELHPVTGRPAAWVPADDAQLLEEAGYTTWDAAAFVVLQLTATLREHAHDFVTLQSVQGMLDQLEGPYPAIVQEVTPKLVGLQDLTDILRRLSREGISLRQLPKMLQVLAERAQVIKDPLVLTEEVRAGLCRYITHKYASASGDLAVYLVDSEVENTIAGAVRERPEGSYLSLAPQMTREFLDAVGDEVRADVDAGRAPILLTDQRVRRYIKRLVSLELPQVVVLSFQELDPAMRVQPLGRIDAFRR